MTKRTVPGDIISATVIFHLTCKLLRESALHEVFYSAKRYSVSDPEEKRV